MEVVTLGDKTFSLSFSNHLLKVYFVTKLVVKEYKINMQNSFITFQLSERCRHVEVDIYHMQRYKS